jgi:hypothetical protein
MTATGTKAPMPVPVTISSAIPSMTPPMAASGSAAVVIVAMEGFFRAAISPLPSRPGTPWQGGAGLRRAAGGHRWGSVARPRT